MLFQVSYEFLKNRQEQKVSWTLVARNPKCQLNSNVKLNSKVAHLQNFHNLKIYINDAEAPELHQMQKLVKRNSTTDVSWVITESIAICSALLKEIISCIGQAWQKEYSDYRTMYYLIVLALYIVF